MGGRERDLAPEARMRMQFGRNSSLAASRAENCVTSKTLTPPPASLLGKKDCVLLDPSSEVLANNEATPLSFWHFRTIATREQGLKLMLGKANEEPLLAAHDARSLTHPDITSHTDTHHARAHRLLAWEQRLKAGDAN